ADDRLADGQSHPGPAPGFFGSEERIENPARIQRRNSVAGIFEYDFQFATLTVCAAFRANPECAALRSHRIEGIHLKIDEHLLKLARITFGQQGLVTQLGAYLDVPACRFGLHQAHRVIDDLAKVTNRAAGFTAAPVVEQHPDDSRDAVDLSNDYLQAPAGLVGVRLAVQQVFGAPANHSHRGADFMRQPRGDA